MNFKEERKIKVIEINEYNTSDEGFEYIYITADSRYFLRDLYDYLFDDGLLAMSWDESDPLAPVCNSLPKIYESELLGNKLPSFLLHRS